jgi:putative transposase
MTGQPARAPLPRPAQPKTAQPHKGIQVGRKRVARLMSRAGLAGVCRRKFVVTTVKGDNRQAPDLVERNFAAEAPDRLWVADISVPQEAA